MIIARTHRRHDALFIAHQAGSVAADVLLRQEPTEEEDEGDRKEDDDDDDEDDEGYSVGEG
jgi:hypothetical protein